MRRGSGIIAVTVAAALTLGLLPGTAPAAPSAASATCSIGVSSVTAEGSARGQGVLSTVPPSVLPADNLPGVYPKGQVRLSSSMTIREDGFGGVSFGSYVVMGDGLYRSGFSTKDGKLVSTGFGRIGGGWSNFTALEEAEYQGAGQAGVSRVNTYALRNDGVLFRWTTISGVWRNRVSYPGFAAVKSMALISKTATYDTFLANTRGGALYTIHIPTASPLKPVVKLVRRSTWQGFEAMLGNWCGLYGTLLLGIDKDGKTGYLYAVGHANGLSTVIQSRGKVPVSFADPVYFRAKDWGSPLFGE